MSMNEMMVNDALEGRICLGKSKHGDAPEIINLAVTGKFAYEMQQFFEAEASKGGDFFRVRFMVLLAEQLRLAVAEARDHGRRQKEGR